MEQRLEIELAEVRPKVFALARKFFRAARMDSDPEDVVQDVLLRLCEARQSGADIRSMEAWAVTTTKNVCVSLWRKSRKSLILPLKDEILSADTSSGMIEVREAESAVKRAMETIPENTRYLLRLRAKGLSLDEMAAVTGRPKGSIKSSISAARKEMIRMINQK